MIFNHPAILRPDYRLDAGLKQSKIAVVITFPPAAHPKRPEIAGFPNFCAGLRYSLVLLCSAVSVYVRNHGGHF